MGLKSTFKKFFDLDDDLDEVLKEAFAKHYETQVVTPSRTVRKTGRRPFVDSINTHSTSNVIKLKDVQQQPTKVLLLEPTGFDDVQAIADHLKNRRSVVFNIRQLNMSDAKRMIDFLSGTVYALEGHIQKLDPNTFMCAPNHVDINGVISEAMAKQQ